MAQDESETALSSTAFGASLFTVGRLLSSLLSFVVNFLLTNLLGPASYGLFAYSQTILSFTLYVTDLGTDKALSRFLPEYEGDTAKQEVFFTLSLFSVFVASVAVSVGIYLSAPLVSRVTLDDATFVLVLRIFAFILPFKSLTRVIENTFRALDEPTFQIGLSQFLESISKLSAAVLTVTFAFSVTGAAMAFLVAAVLLFLIAVSAFLSNVNLRPTVAPKREEVGEFGRYTLPLTLEVAGFLLTNYVDLLMVGIFFSSSVVGYYRIAGLLAGIVALPLSGLNQIFPPYASKLYTNGRFDALDDLYTVTTRWSITATIPVVVGLGVYRTEILALFGNEFTTATLVLVVLLLSGLFHAAAGPCGLLLMMTDHQYLVMVNNWLLAGLNVLLNLYFIHRFGFVGAAVATTISVVCLNVLKIAEVWQLEGMFPYSRTLYKPMLSAVVCLVAMSLSRTILNTSLDVSSPVSILLGGTIGVTAQLGTIVFLGVESTDEEVLRNVVPNPVVTLLES